MSSQPPKASPACPKCGSSEIIPHGKRYALYPSGCVMALAPLLAWLHRLSAPHDFECSACGHRFARRDLPAKIAFYGTLALLIGTFILAFILEFSKE